MNESESACFNLPCVVQLLVCSGLAASTKGWLAFWKSCPGRTWEWSGRKTAWSPCGEIPSVVPASISSEWEKSQLRSWFVLASEWENPINEAAKPGPYERKIPTAEFGLRESHSGVSWMPERKSVLPTPSGENLTAECHGCRKEVCVATSEWGTPIPTY